MVTSLNMPPNLNCGTGGRP